MEKDNKVSIWIGDFSDKESLNDYFEEKYNDDGDVSSDFMSEFEIDYIDNHFQEVVFRENMISKEEIFKDFSYLSSYLNSIPNKNWGKYNSIVCIYNFEYLQNIEKTSALEFLGVYDFVNE